MAAGFPRVSPGAIRGGRERNPIEEVRTLTSKTRMVVVLAVLAAVSAEAQSESPLDGLLSARVVELNFVWDKTSPLLGLNPPYTLGLQASHRETAGMVPGGLAFAADMMFFSGQHGAPNLDAVGHISHDGELYGGKDAFANEGADGLLEHGIETYPAERFVNRGVLLDVARFKGVEALEPGYEITASDLEATAEAQGVEVREGDSVLIRTGYGRYYASDKEKYMGFRPGPGEEAALWLADKGVFLAGDDQLTFEVAPESGTIFPCHRILLADHGIYIVENMNLEELASVLAGRGSYEFALVMNPPRIKGATGAAVNAFALVP